MVIQQSATPHILLPISIEKWLAQDGWNVETSEEKACFLLRQKGSFLPWKNEPVYLTLRDHWACLVYPLKPPPGEQSDAYQRLLEWNQRNLLGCKFALDAEGRIILLAELPRKALSPELLEPILKNLIHTAKSYPQGENLPEDDRPTVTQPGVDIEYFIQLAMVEECYLQRRLNERSLLFHYKAFFSPHDLYVTAGNRWLYMQMLLLNPNQEEGLRGDPEHRLTFFQYMLRLNQMLYQAKLGLDSGSKVVLNIEVPLRTLEKSTFQHSLRTLLYYTRCTTRELLLVASLERDAGMYGLVKQAVSGQRKSSGT